MSLLYILHPTWKIKSRNCSVCDPCVSWHMLRRVKSRSEIYTGAHCWHIVSKLFPELIVFYGFVLQQTGVCVLQCDRPTAALSPQFVDGYKCKWRGWRVSFNIRASLPLLDMKISININTVYLKLCSPHKLCIHIWWNYTHTKEDFKICSSVSLDWISLSHSAHSLWGLLSSVWPALPIT